MNPDFLVWAQKPKTNALASLYYRLEVPLRALQESNRAVCMYDEILDKETSAQMMLGADIDVFWSISGDERVDQVRELKMLRALQKEDGSYYIPPSIIYDCDDNHDYAHPFNSVYCSSGVRNYPDGEFLTEGDTLHFVDPENKKEILWQDKVTRYGGVYFDIKRNLQTMNSRHKIIRAVDGVTVPVPALAQYIKEVIGQTNVHIFPNTILIEDYISYPLLPRTDGTVRVVWQGGSSHYTDWYPLRGAMIEILNKYPQVKIILFGEIFDWISDIVPREQLEVVKWVDHSAYKLRRGLLQADINLCPLTDNPFNRCKSAIKWYEGSVWDKPETTLAANVSPYKDEMVDNETGLLYNTPEEFVQKLGLLIEDAQLRARLGVAAKKWIMQNRTPETTIPGLFDFYLDCRARKQREILMR